MIRLRALALLVHALRSRPCLQNDEPAATMLLHAEEMIDRLTGLTRAVLAAAMKPAEDGTKDRPASAAA